MNNAWTVTLIAPCRCAPTAKSSFKFAINALLKAPTVAEGPGARTYCTALWRISPFQSRTREQDDCWSIRTPTSNTARRHLSPSALLHARKSKPTASSTLKVSQKSAKVSNPREHNILRGNLARPTGQHPKWNTVVQNGEAFGRPMPIEQGTTILRKLQTRRAEGSLADKGISNLGCSDEEAKKALDWLREKYPMDEETIAVQWAEKEAARLETLYSRQAQKIGLFKKDEDYVEPQAGVYGVVDESSVLVQRQKALAAEKKAREEEEAKKKEEEERQGISRPEGPKYVMPWNNTALQEKNKATRAHWARLSKAAELRVEDIFAERSAFSRLWAPTLFGGVVVFLAVTLATMYEPPRREGRLWSDTPPAVSTCIFLATINAAAFLLWRRPQAWYYMNRLMMLSAGAPNPLSVLGNIFSHQQTWHLAQNMGFLLLVGPLVHEDVGRGNFLALYLCTGVFGSLFNLYVNVLRRNFTTATVGASGSLLGLLGAYFMLEDRHEMRFPFTDAKFEFSSKLGLGIWFVLEILAFVQQRGKADHLSHFGGMIAGLVGGWWLRRRGQGEMKGREKVDNDVEVRGDAIATQMTKPVEQS